MLPWKVSATIRPKAASQGTAPARRPRHQSAAHTMVSDTAVAIQPPRDNVAMRAGDPRARPSAARALQLGPKEEASTAAAAGRSISKYAAALFGDPTVPPNRADATRSSLHSSTRPWTQAKSKL